MNINQAPNKCNTPFQILHPETVHITGLRTLWKEAFGDEDTFLDLFFSTAFAPERCLCILIENNVAAALYWFQCEYSNQPLAYIYAVATAKVYRGRGLCQQLLTATHSTLKRQGYVGAVLVPGSETLFDFYKKTGYQTACYRNTYHYDLHTCMAQAPIVNQTFSANQTSDMPSLSAASIFPMKEISATEHAALRKDFLPLDSILQEKENLAFLQTQLKFYSGENFLIAVTIIDQGQTLYCPELLYTDTTAILSNDSLPDNYCRQDLMDYLLSYFGCNHGIFCTPGGDSPFAMYYPLNNSTDKKPHYFAFAFD